MKRSKTSERNYTQRSIIFLLFFLCLILLFTSCRDSSKYDFKTSSDAISAYREADAYIRRRNEEHPQDELYEHWYVKKTNAR